MASPSPEAIANGLRRGFRFDPKPRDVVTYYLPRHIAGEPMHAMLRAFMHEADVYACAPDVLAAQFEATPPAEVDRYFFTPAPRQGNAPRVAGPGSWSLQKSEDIEVEDLNNNDGVKKVGEIRELRYKYDDGEDAGGASEWAMEEFSCACSLEDAVVGDKEIVFCRIYKSTTQA